jgi:hypothetical protein
MGFGPGLTGGLLADWDEFGTLACVLGFLAGCGFFIDGADGCVP